MPGYTVDGSLSIGLQDSQLMLRVGETEVSLSLPTTAVTFRGVALPQIQQTASVGDIVHFQITPTDDELEIIDRRTGAVVFTARNIEQHVIECPRDRTIQNGVEVMPADDGTPIKRTSSHRFSRKHLTYCYLVDPELLEPLAIRGPATEKVKPAYIGLPGDSENEKAMSNNAHLFITNLLQSIQKDRRWEDYSEPVNARELAQVAGHIFNDYIKVIKRPMDLKTITEKHKQKVYTSIEEISADIELMADNAREWHEYYLRMTTIESDKEVVKTGHTLWANWLRAIAAYERDPTDSSNIIKNFGSRGSIDKTKASKPTPSTTQSSKRKHDRLSYTPTHPIHTRPPHPPARNTSGPTSCAATATTASTSAATKSKATHTPNTPATPTPRAKSTPTQPTSKPKKRATKPPSSSRAARPRHRPSRSRRPRPAKKPKIWNEKLGDEDYIDSGDSGSETDHTDDAYDSYDDGSGFVYNGRVERVKGSGVGGEVDELMGW